MSLKRCEFFLESVIRDMSLQATLLVHNHCAVNLALSNPLSSMFVDFSLWILNANFFQMHLQDWGEF